MIDLTLAEVAEAVAGRLDGGDPQARVSGPVVVDSRAVVPGALFAALPGENVDGHDYASQAVAGGAVAVLAARPVGVPAVIVDDVLVALGRLAGEVVRRVPDLAVVAVTGSSGKTSTKDLLRCVLSRLGPTVAPQGSFNNELGAPLTALGVVVDTRFLVLEMGARNQGHIKYLCDFTPPDVSVVLNVGSAHVGEFGSQEAIAVAKGELVEALRPQGLAVLNADDPLVAGMASRTEAAVVLVGRAADAQVRAEQVALDESARASFTLVAPEGSAPVRLAVLGEHQVGNALSAAAVARRFGMPVAEIAAALSEAEPASRWRMEVIRRADGVSVVNDAYNANPESVRAALAALAAMSAGGRRRTWAVLGEMRELGDAATEAHMQAGRDAVRVGVTRVVAIGRGPGEDIAAGARDAGGQGEWVEDRDAAFSLLREAVRPGDVVLVKASRAVGLEHLAQALVESVGEEQAR